MTCRCYSLWLKHFVVETHFSCKCHRKAVCRNVSFTTLKIKTPASFYSYLPHSHIFSLPLAKKPREGGENGTTATLNGSGRISSVIPGWFSKISPMWPGVL